MRRVLCFYVDDYGPEDAKDEAAQVWGSDVEVIPVPLPAWRQPSDPARTEEIRRAIYRLRGDS